MHTLRRATRDVLRPHCSRSVTLLLQTNATRRDMMSTSNCLQPQMENLTNAKVGYEAEEDNSVQVQSLPVSVNSATMTVTSKLKLINKYVVVV